MPCPRAGLQIVQGGVIQVRISQQHPFGVFDQRSEACQQRRTFPVTGTGRAGQQMPHELHRFIEHQVAPSKVVGVETQQAIDTGADP